VCQPGWALWPQGAASGGHTHRTYRLSSGRCPLGPQPGPGGGPRVALQRPDASRLVGMEGQEGLSYRCVPWRRQHGLPLGPVKLGVIGQAARTGAVRLAAPFEVPEGPDWPAFRVPVIRWGVFVARVQRGGLLAQEPRTTGPPWATVVKKARVEEAGLMKEVCGLAVPWPRVVDSFQEGGGCWAEDRPGRRNGGAPAQEVLRSSLSDAAEGAG